MPADRTQSKLFFMFYRKRKNIVRKRRCCRIKDKSTTYSVLCGKQVSIQEIGFKCFLTKLVFTQLCCCITIITGTAIIFSSQVTSVKVSSIYLHIYFYFFKLYYNLLKLRQQYHTVQILLQVLHLKQYLKKGTKVLAKTNTHGIHEN